MREILQEENHYSSKKRTTHGSLSLDGTATTENEYFVPDMNDQPKYCDYFLQKFGHEIKKDNLDSKDLSSNRESLAFLQKILNRCEMNGQSYKNIQKIIDTDTYTSNRNRDNNYTDPYLYFKNSGNLHNGFQKTLETINVEKKKKNSVRMDKLAHNNSQSKNSDMDLIMLNDPNYDYHHSFKKNPRNPTRFSRHSHHIDQNQPLKKKNDQIDHHDEFYLKIFIITFLILFTLGLIWEILILYLEWNNKFYHLYNFVYEQNPGKLPAWHSSNNFRNFLRTILPSYIKFSELILGFFRLGLYYLFLLPLYKLQGLILHFLVSFILGATGVIFIVIHFEEKFFGGQYVRVLLNDIFSYIMTKIKLAIYKLYFSFFVNHNDDKIINNANPGTNNDSNYKSKDNYTKKYKEKKELEICTPCGKTVDLDIQDFSLIGNLFENFLKNPNIYQKNLINAILQKNVKELDKNFETEFIERENLKKIKDLVETVVSSNREFGNPSINVNESNITVNPVRMDEDSVNKRKMFAYSEYDSPIDGIETTNISEI